MPACMPVCCQALVNIAWSFATLLGPACCQQPSIHQLFLLIHNESLTRLRCTALVLGSGQSLPYVGGGGFNEQALSNAVYAFDKVGQLSSELLSAVFEVSALRLRRGSMAHHPDLNTFKPQELCTLLKACHTNIAPPWVFLSSLLRLLSAHPGMADSWTTAERLELHRACQLFSGHQAEAAAAVAAAGRQGLAATDFSQAMSAAQGLANSIASSISAAGGVFGSVGASGPPSMGRLSGLGTSPPSLSMMGDGGRMSGGAFGGRPRSSSGASGSAFAPSGGMGAGPFMLAVSEADAATTTFGQLSASAGMVSGGLSAADMQVYEQLVDLQQRQQQQQQQAMTALLQQALNSSVGAAAGGQQVLSCPVCNVLVRQQEALGHIKACLVKQKMAAASLDFLLKQQQQQQEAAAAAQWAAQVEQQQQQHNNLVLARLQQLQQQQNLINAAAAARQQQQSTAALLGSLEELYRPGADAAAADAAGMAPWMLDATAAAARPPLRPMRRA